MHFLCLFFFTMRAQARTDSGAAAKGFLKTVTSLRFVKLLHFLCDIFHYLGKLSETLQKEDVVVSDIPAIIESTRKKLKRLRKGPRINGLLQTFTTKYDVQTQLFEGTKLSQKHAGRTDSDAATILEATLNHMDERFQSVRGNRTLSAMTIFNPITWPEDLEDFGDAEIATLASAFKDHLVRVAPKREGELDEQPDEQLREEWEDWLDLVGPSARRPKSFRELMGRLCDGRARFPLLHVLLQIVDVLPSQTATVERGFSLLNRLKDKKRVALEEDSLQDLMAVCSNGASLKEWSHADAIKAITLWSQTGPGTRHFRGHAAGSGRKAATMDLTCDSEESQDEDDIVF